MHLLFQASQRANMWPSGAIKQTNTVKMEGHEAENHAGIVNPSRNWCNCDCLTSVHTTTPGLNQVSSNYPQGKLNECTTLAPGARAMQAS